MSDALESHFLLASVLNQDPARTAELASLRQQHIDGLKVMGGFKKLLTEIVNDFLGDFQARSASISDAEIKKVLLRGGAKTKRQANRVMNRASDAMGLRRDGWLND